MEVNNELKADKVKIVTFGPGIGESLIVKIPNVGWGVIDSCLVKIRNQKINPALEYLKANNVHQLAFIILTHPHEDHYNGLDQIVEYYLGRIERICYYSGNGISQYREYLARKNFLGGQGLLKFSNIFKKFKEAKENGANVIRISERTEIIRRGRFGNHEVEMIALSPSEESERKYVEILYEAIPKEDGDIVRELSDSQQNLLSSAVWCSIGNLILVFGSDLEKGENNHTGWKCVLNNIDKPELSANFVKVPHHGSSNAFHRPLWEEFSRLTPPVSVITPYVRLSSPLPREENIRKISEFSSKIAITSSIRTVKFKHIYDRRAIDRLYGVIDWKNLADPDQIGYVEIDLSIENSSISNLEIIPPAYLWN